MEDKAVEKQKTNRIFLLVNDTDFSKDLLTKLDAKYDVDVFSSVSEVKKALTDIQPIALISTVHSNENLEMMKGYREVPFKSQYLEDYNIDTAQLYGRYCACISGYAWINEVLNASCTVIDSKILKESVGQAIKRHKASGTIPVDGYSPENVRMKTKESNRLPVADIGVSEIMANKRSS